MRISRRYVLPILVVFILVMMSVRSIADSGSVATIPSLPNANTLTWAWLFSYRGGLFQPTIQLNLSESQVLSAVAQLSTVVAHDNLALVRVVAYQRGYQIQPSALPQLQAYVATLHQYAKYVIGWTGFQNFNLTTTPTIYTVVSRLAATGVDGIWLDQTSSFYFNVGQTVFSNLMQNLTNQNPNIFWMMNYAGSASITPLPGSTWGNATYAAASPNKNSYNNVNLLKVATLNTLYPGRVVMHFDADAQNPGAPMSLFSNLNSTQQETVVAQMVAQGKQYGYSMLYPVLGANSDANSTYEGTIYNSLGIGMFARWTFMSWLSDMAVGHSYPVTFSEVGLPEGTSWRIQLDNTTYATSNGTLIVLGGFGIHQWSISAQYQIGTSLIQDNLSGVIDMPFQKLVNVSLLSAVMES